MPSRSRGIASIRSSRSAIRPVIWSSSSVRSCSAWQVDGAEALALADEMRSELFRRSSFGRFLVALPGFVWVRSRRAGSRFSSSDRVDFMLMVGARRAAPIAAFFGGAASCARADRSSAASFSGLVGAASAVSPSARASAARRRSGRRRLQLHRSGLPLGVESSPDGLVEARELFRDTG